MYMIRKRQLRFLGHVIRLKQLESVYVTGRMEGRRGRGRPRKKLVDSQAKVVGREIFPAELQQMMFERARWRSMMANVLRIRHCGKVM